MAKGWNKTKKEGVILLFARSALPRERDSQLHRKWEEKILLMLDGRTKPYRVCWQHENF
jgi:hypothetical protein